MRKVINAFLVGAIVVAGLLVWRMNGERVPLRAELARLVRETGELEITDSTKIHILALETGDPPPLCLARLSAAEPPARVRDWQAGYVRQLKWRGKLNGNELHPSLARSRGRRSRENRDLLEMGKIFAWVICRRSHAFWLHAWTLARTRSIASGRRRCRGDRSEGVGGIAPAFDAEDDAGGSDQQTTVGVG